MIVLLRGWVRRLRQLLINPLIKNTSGLSPRGRAVLLMDWAPELKETLVALPDQVAHSQMLMNQRAIVVAIGPCAWEDESQPRAAVGEKVLVTKFAGFIASSDVTADGKVYRLVNDRDVFAAIVAEPPVKESA